MARRSLVLTLCSILFLVPPIAAGARKAAAIQVGGGWVEEMSCVPGEFTPAPDLNTAHGTCTATATWIGGWTGQAVTEAEYTLDLTTLDLEGTARETFTGVYTGDGSTGSISFLDVFSSDGRTGWFHVESQILGGTGDFAGSGGSAVFDGYQALSGGYSATWYR